MVLQVVVCMYLVAIQCLISHQGMASLVKGVTEDIERAFHNWLKATGSIPDVCDDSLPAIQQGVSGSWEWNPNISDPTVTRTCLPIYYFSWEWSTEPEGLQVHVERSTMGGAGDASWDVLITAQGVRRDL